MSRVIAFFDFDGTITTKDTLLEFIKYSKGSFRFYLGFGLNSPWLIAWKLGIISNQKAKERILRFFFKNRALDDFQQECDRFSEEIIPGLLRPKALEEIARLQKAGAELVIVSASPGNWIRGWAGHIGSALQATQLETRLLNDQPRLTGRIDGRNCHGLEKVRRIRAAWSLSDYQHIYTYGDSSGDKPMLELGTISFYKPFR
ncbi:MAG TPA: HAD-IB family hydrolase [Puia sp.]|jgi:HAD superfamily hydrolase (TIGR01490 family)